MERRCKILTQSAKRYRLRPKVKNLVFKMEKLSIRLPQEVWGGWGDIYFPFWSALSYVYLKWLFSVFYYANQISKTSKRFSVIWWDIFRAMHHCTIIPKLVNIEVHHCSSPPLYWNPCLSFPNLASVNIQLNTYLENPNLTKYFFLLAPIQHDLHNFRVLNFSHPSGINMHLCRDQLLVVSEM